MYDRILVPTDGSPEVERAVRHAVDLAAAHGARLHAVYVVNRATYGGLPMETSWEGLDQVLRDEGEEALDRVEELAAQRSVAADGRVLEGSPSAEIVRYAEAEDCDLVVMGTHGRGGLDRLLLGSVAERVVRSCPVPVLTVRVGDEDGEAPAEEAGTEPDDGADAGDDPGTEPGDDPGAAGDEASGGEA